MDPVGRPARSEPRPGASVLARWACPASLSPEIRPLLTARVEPAPPLPENGGAPACPSRALTLGKTRESMRNDDGSPKRMGQVCRPFPLVGESSFGTLSRWRHRFEPRWDCSLDQRRSSEDRVPLVMDNLAKRPSTAVIPSSPFGVGQMRRAHPISIVLGVRLRESCKRALADTIAVTVFDQVLRPVSVSRPAIRTVRTRHSSQRLRSRASPGEINRSQGSMKGTL